MRAFFELIALGCGREQRSRGLGIAGIHATVLTILIGIISVYYIFTLDKIHEMEMEALREAEKINQVQFVRSYYGPTQDDFSKIKDPRNVEQLIQLPISLFLVLSQAKGETNLHGVKIPTVPADRAERALQIMNLLVHRYPFPESISVNSSFAPKPLLFKDRAEIAKWSDGLERLLGSMRLFIYMAPVFIGPQMDVYFKALSLRNKELIERGKTDPLLQVEGYIDPYFILNDFTRNLQRADEINHSVKFCLDKVDTLERRFVSKKHMLIGIGLTFLAFFCGVILPLFTGRVMRVFLLWIPCCFYILAFCFLVYRLLD